MNTEGMAEVALWDERVRIHDGYPYQPQDVYQVLAGVLAIAKAKGLYEPYITLEPEWDRYDGGCLGIDVVPRGYRAKTEDELKADALENEIDALAEKLGVSHYEAKAIYENLDKIKEYLND